MHEKTTELATSQTLNQEELAQINGGRPGGQPVVDMPVPKIPIWYVDPVTGDGFWLC